MPFSSGDSSPLVAPPSGTVMRLTGGGCPGFMPRSASVGACAAGSLLWGGSCELGTGGCGIGASGFCGGFSGGFAGCTAEGASGMVWSPCDCPFPAGFAAGGGDEDCPQADTHATKVRSRMTTNSHSVRRSSSPGLSKPRPPQDSGNGMPGRADLVHLTSREIDYQKLNVEDLCPALPYSGHPMLF